MVFAINFHPTAPNIQLKANSKYFIMKYDFNPVEICLWRASIANIEKNSSFPVLNLNTYLQESI